MKWSDANMSDYHPVLFGITSWRRRSKKSREITLFQSTKASQISLIFQNLFFPKFYENKEIHWTMDLKRKKEFNFIYLPIHFEHVITCWISICFFHQNVEFWWVNILYQFDILWKKISFQFPMNKFLFFNEFMTKIVRYGQFSI